MIRCRKNGLAIIVKSDAGNEGMIVRCLELFGINLECLGPKGEVERGAVWLVDQELLSWAGDRQHLILDSQLKPLDDRSPDEVDEMIELFDEPEMVK